MVSTSAKVFTITGNLNIDTPPASIFSINAAIYYKLLIIKTSEVLIVPLIVLVLT